MRIAISADHRGTAAAQLLADKLARDGHEVQLFQEKTIENGQNPAASQQPGVQSTHASMVDYPEAAYHVGKAVADGKAELGLLICGTGIGMSIAANKVKGVRAAAVHDELTAEICRSHNDANVLCLSADLLGQRLIESIAATFLNTPFQGGRHARRLDKIRAIEEGQDPTTRGS